VRRHVLLTSVLASLVATSITRSSGAKSPGGVITGRIIFSGEIKKPKKITATTDTAICGQQDLIDESLLINPNTKGVASVVAWMPGSKRPATTITERTLDNYRCRYEPHVLVLHTDQKLRIKNRDRFLHTTQAMLGRKSKFNLALPTRNQVIKKSLKKPGFYSIHCDVHDWMKAYVAVFKDEVATVTSSVGEFMLENLPLGKQKLNLWHETLGRKTIDIEVHRQGQELLIPW
jgi:plastocyanin